MTLNSIHFNGLVDFSTTKNITSLFHDCYSIQVIDFACSNFIQLEKAVDTFKRCKLLKKIIGLNWNMPNLKVADGMFHGCNNIKEIVFNNINLSNLESAHNMFYRCSSIENIDLRKTCLENLENANSMFSDCYSLKQMYFSQLPKVKKVEYMFYQCRKLKAFDFHVLTTGTLETITNMFYGCNELEGEATFSKMTYLGTNANSVFENCESITKIDMSNVTMPNIEKIDSFAEGCFNLTFLELGHAHISKVHESISLNNFAKQCEKLKYAGLGNLVISNKLITSCAFKNCSELQVVNIGFNFENIVRAKEMFAGCRKLRVLNTKQNIKQFKIDNCLDMFCGCDNLKALDIFGLFSLDITEEKTAIEKIIQLPVVASGLLPQKMDLVYIDKENKNIVEEILDARTNKKETIVSAT